MKIYLLSSCFEVDGLVTAGYAMGEESLKVLAKQDFFDNGEEPYEVDIVVDLKDETVNIFDKDGCLLRRYYVIPMDRIEAGRAELFGYNQMKQAEDRMHRLAKPVEITHLIKVESVDDALRETLEKKQTIMDELLEDDE